MQLIETKFLCTVRKIIGFTDEIIGNYSNIRKMSLFTDELH